MNREEIKEELKGRKGRKEGDELGNQRLLDAAYKYNGRWYHGVAIGYYGNVNIMSVNELFYAAPKKNKGNERWCELTKEGSFVEAIFIFGIDIKNNGALHLGGNKLIQLTDVMMIQGSIGTIECGIGGHGLSLERLWVWGKLDHYRCPHFPVKYLRVPSDTKTVGTTNRTTIPNLNKLSNRGLLVRFIRPSPISER